VPAKFNGEYLRIVDWNEIYETHRSRELVTIQIHAWFPMPVAHEGLSFRWINRCRNPEAVFGVQHLLILLAVRVDKPNRGTLAVEGQPLTARDLAALTTWDEELLEHAFTVLASKEVHFLERVEFADGTVKRTLDAHQLPDSAGRDTANKPAGRDTAPIAIDAHENGPDVDVQPDAATDRDGPPDTATDRDGPPARGPSTPRQERRRNKEQEQEERKEVLAVSTGPARLATTGRRKRTKDPQEQKIKDQKNEEAAEWRDPELDGNELGDIRFLQVSTIRILTAAGIAQSNMITQIDSTQAVLRLVMFRDDRDAEVAFMVKEAKRIRLLRLKNKMAVWQASMNKRYDIPATPKRASGHTNGRDTKPATRRQA